MSRENNFSNASEKVEEISKLKTFFGLFKFIMIFIILYFAQYFVNQGLVSYFFFIKDADK